MDGIKYVQFGSGISWILSVKPQNRFEVLIPVLEIEQGTSHRKNFLSKIYSLKDRRLEPRKKL